MPFLNHLLNFHFATDFMIFHYLTLSTPVPNEASPTFFSFLFLISGVFILCVYFHPTKSQKEFTNERQDLPWLNSHFSPKSCWSVEDTEWDVISKSRRSWSSRSYMIASVHWYLTEIQQAKVLPCKVPASTKWREKQKWKLAALDSWCSLGTPQVGREEFVCFLKLRKAVCWKKLVTWCSFLNCSYFFLSLTKYMLEPFLIWFSPLTMSSISMKENGNILAN